MANGVTRLTDVIVPQIFTPYVAQLTEEKTRFIQSGAMSTDASLSALLSGGGLTFNVPSFRDLDNDPANVSTDDPATFSSPSKILTSQEIGVRLNRNQSWSSMDLTAQLAGADPMEAIGNAVARYWSRQLQRAAIATARGVFADNAAAPSGSDTHTINDMTRDVSGGAFVAGVTNFTAEAVIDATATMGDSMDDLALITMHSIVYARAQKNNLIDFIPDSNGVVNIPVFQGKAVVVDDGMPAAGGVYESWLFGAGAIRFGSSPPPLATETWRDPKAGTGGGQDVLHSRVQWMIHPAGHAYVGTAPNGGPSDAATANNLANAGSWSRRFPERKQIKIARLITREA